MDKTQADKIKASKAQMTAADLERNVKGCEYRLRDYETRIAMAGDTGEDAQDLESRRAEYAEVLKVLQS